MSDIHFDEPHFNRSLFIDHMEFLKSVGGRCLIPGDFLSAINRHDKRFSTSAVNSKYLFNESLFEETCNDFVDLLKPYADIIDVISAGNHELKAYKMGYGDLVQRVITLLNDHLIKIGSNHRIQHGSMSGGIQYRLLRELKGKQAHSLELNIVWFHFGNQTKLNQQMKQWSGYDFIFTGHIHKANTQPERTFHFPTLREKPEIKYKDPRIIIGGNWSEPDIKNEFEFYYDQKGKKRKRRTSMLEVGYGEGFGFAPLPFSQAIGICTVNTRKGRLVKSLSGLV